MAVTVCVSLMDVLSICFSSPRYEIAPDEVRVELAYNVAKRYLGLCTESQATEDSGGGGGDGDDGKCDDDSGIGGDTKKLSNHDDPAAEKKSLAGSNSLTNNAVAKATTPSANNSTTNTTTTTNAIKKCPGGDDDYSDDCVLDILNDDIVAQVRSRLLSRLKQADYRRETVTNLLRILFCR